MSFLPHWTTIANGFLFAASLCGWMASGRQHWVLIFTHFFAVLFGGGVAISVIAWVLS